MGRDLGLGWLLLLLLILLIILLTILLLLLLLFIIEVLGNKDLGFSQGLAFAGRFGGGVGGREQGFCSG